MSEFLSGSSAARSTYRGFVPDDSARPSGEESKTMATHATEQDIIALIEKKGVQTGAELLALSGLDVFPLWQHCMRSTSIRTKVFGRRYLRLDRAVEGYARLSPSIRRELLTYTVCGLEHQLEAIERRAQVLRDEVVGISRTKWALAEECVRSTVGPLEVGQLLMQDCCFVIAGDVTYDMSHAVPRPETSTGMMVNGSDLDIIMITRDGMSDHALKSLDRAVYERKYYMLKHPSYREEIDYVIKSVSRVREQMRFDTFESMVACKILDEGRLLCGSQAIFSEIKALLDEYQIPEKLRQLEESATQNREKAVASLLRMPADSPENEYRNLFYTRDEKDEIF